jgi:PadR family transcriptional regulator PadR
MSRNQQFTFNQLIVLGLLKDREMYGMEVVRAAAAKTSANQASVGNIYPLLKDLVRDGWLSARRGTGSPRIYYRLTEQGREHLPGIAAHWEHIHDSLDELLGSAPVLSPAPANPGTDKARFHQ